MTTRESLLASLHAIAEHDAAISPENGGYIDWSIRDGAEWNLEVGDDDDTVQLTLTRADMVRLHRALTLTLLQEGVQ